MERTASARKRGAVEVVLISLMQDAGLRRWPRQTSSGDGSGRVCIGGRGGQPPRGEHRHDETPVAGPSRRWSGRARPNHDTEPESHTDRRGGEADGVERALFWGQPIPVG